MVTFDKSFGRYIFGIDEVGLGPLAGPVVVCCVGIDTKYCPIIQATDSKKLTPKKRENIFQALLPFRNNNIFWGLSATSAPDLDLQGIPMTLKNGVQKAFDRCLKISPFKPDHILIDGNRFFDLQYPSTSIIKGDAKSYSIALASIVAKVIRDRWMIILAKEYPEFGFETHKGYGTKKHLEAISRLPITKHHRRSYQPIKGSIDLIRTKVQT